MLRRVALAAAAALAVAGCAAGPVPAPAPAPDQTTASATPSPWPRAMYMCLTDGSEVPVYAFPDVHSGVVDVLNFGDRVTILGVVEGWGTVEGLTAVFYVQIAYLVPEMCGD